MVNFTHLHVHTQYSILDGACSIKRVVKKTKDLGMNALAITDHGNMYGVLSFRNKCVEEGIKPILGCEMYVTKGSRFVKDGIHFSGNHLILLAKNFTGYQNLIKLDSLAFEKDAFYRTSRIDEELLFQHSEGLICSSACVAGIIPRLLANGDVEGAEKKALEYKNVFKDDYYIEIQNHGIEIEDDVRPQLIALANKLDIKVIATNDVHFINKEDFYAHRILICLNTGKKINEDNKLMYSGQEYMKSGQEMMELFSDIPQAITNTQEIVDKVEVYELERKPILPVFDIPESFGKEEDYYKRYSQEDIKKEIYDGLLKRGKIKQEESQEKKEELVEQTLKDKGGYDKQIRVKFDCDYLRHLTYQGAEKLYPTPLPKEIKDRLEMELDTIEWMGFPGYFLIVQDFINYSRDNLGVIVGPGRGSAAGSVVAYCLGITLIEPMKYGLLFERFLNPDRISLPDIDVDFDDEGRAKTLHYVQQKYGITHVAQITTFGSMAAKSAIKDVARVMDLPLNESNRLAKLVPDRVKGSLEDIYEQTPELKQELENGSELVRKVLTYAKELEGSIRSTGVHACGVIIGPDDISNYVPLTMPKDSDMMATQFEGKLIESVGMIKMDFLGLSNLSIIKDACENIYKTQKIKIEPDKISLEDKQTLELFQRGDTVATFQFESAGMRQHLQNLKPDKFEDLIAMNALYRPGPMRYIPDFIDRKHGRQKIEYPFPIMEKYLSDTYGITVYQEQVMQLSRALASFTPGEADTLRKAMGKKKIDMMTKMQQKFDAGCKANGLDQDKTKQIWEDWKKFAEYAFNKSHATCYAYIAFQTGYLKAHYPAEYMSAVLTHNLNRLDVLTAYIADCKNRDIDVLGPNVNESDVNFMVNKKGQILFGLAAIKGVGMNVALDIINEREQNGEYKSPFDFIERVNQMTVNRRCMEALVKSGAFDCFQGINRSQYLFVYDEKNNIDFLDKLLKYGLKKKASKSSSQQSLFGGDVLVEEETLSIPACEEWSKLEMLKNEKDMIGFYLSGHPLDIYSNEIDTFVNTEVKELEDIQELSKKDSVRVAGVVVSSGIKKSKNGNQYGELKLQDKSGEYLFRLFGKEFISFQNFMLDNLYILIKGHVAENKFKDSKTGEEKTVINFKIDKIELLEEIFKNYAKDIKLYVSNDDITEDFVSSISSIAKKAKGNVPIYFVVSDYNEHIDVTLKSTKLKVDVHDFIQQIKPMVNKNTIRKFSVSTANI